MGRSLPHYFLPPIHSEQSGRQCDLPKFNHREIGGFLFVLGVEVTWHRERKGAVRCILSRKNDRSEPCGETQWHRSGRTSPKVQERVSGVLALHFARWERLPSSLEALRYRGPVLRRRKNRRLRRVPHISNSSHDSTPCWFHSRDPNSDEEKTNPL